MSLKSQPVLAMTVPDKGDHLPSTVVGVALLDSLIYVVCKKTPSVFVFNAKGQKQVRVVIGRRFLRIDREVCREGVHPLLPVSRRWVHPINLAYNTPVCQPSACNRTDCSAEFDVSSLAVAKNIASTLLHLSTDGWPG